MNINKNSLGRMLAFNTYDGSDGFMACEGEWIMMFANSICNNN